MENVIHWLANRGNGNRVSHNWQKTLHQYINGRKMNKKIDNKFIKNKRILITGVCGTIGSALGRLLIDDKEIGLRVMRDNARSVL